MLSQNKIEFKPLSADSDLAVLLGLPMPNFPADGGCFRQLKYLQSYVRRADLNSNPNRCIAVESHYIDRDFMSDHSVLFSNMLKPTENYCTRVHFFAGEAAELEGKLFEISDELAKGTEQSRIDLAAEKLSKVHYLGFTVIRPLAGCPVGRTVLHILPALKPEDRSLRVLDATRLYRVHLMGITLCVRGLAFQQQDLGVSRCATVALWCALHKVAQVEPTNYATPAEITNLASKYRLPFGRPLPSEGLNPEQMCLALQSLGVSPFLVKAEAFAPTRGLIYSAGLSGIPAVLIIERVEDQMYHAVTMAGMKLGDAHQLCLVISNQPAHGDDASGDLKALYVHDDRVGPYRRAEVVPSAEGQFRLKIKIQSHVADGKAEEWIVRQILLPLHQKVRLSITELRTLVRRWLIPEIQTVVAAQSGLAEVRKWKENPSLAPTITFSTWIERGHQYVRRATRENLLKQAASRSFRTDSILSRYVAILRFSSPKIGQLDVLLDTTSPRPNYNWIAVLAKDTGDAQAALRKEAAEFLAAKLKCKLYW